MKSRITFLVIGLFVAGAVQAQTRPTTTSPTKPASSTAANRYSVRPPATSASPTPVSPNRQQELYDQYHGVSKKSVAPTPSSTAPMERQAVSRPASRPAPATPTAPVATVAERPVSSDGSTSGVRIGIRGGITRYVLLEKSGGIIDPAIGFVGGVVFNVGRGTLSFQPELNYARYGMKINDPFTNTTLTLNSDQFEVPLFLKIASGSVNSTRFFVNIGPYGAYTSSVSVNGQKGSLEGVPGRFSFGAAAGVGAALKAGPGHVTFELRGLYELGTSDRKISTDSKTILSQATVGYMFPLGGR